MKQVKHLLQVGLIFAGAYLTALDLWQAMLTGEVAIRMRRSLGVYVLGEEPFLFWLFIAIRTALFALLVWASGYTFLGFFRRADRD